MDPAFAVAQLAEKAGVVAVAVGAAGSLLFSNPRQRAAAISLTLVLAGVLLLGHIWHNPQFRSISGNGALFTLLLVSGLGVVAALALLFHKSNELFPIVAVGVLPFRVPIEAAGTTSNLLVPLYVVIAGAAVAHVWREIATPSEQPWKRPGFLHLAIAIFIGLYALQALYSNDFSTALEQMVFFYVPFALLFMLLSEVRWTPRVLVGCVAVLIVLALAFSGIGFWEYHRRELFWNPKVISANQFQSYFRVNSVFWDPNIYGRFLVLVIVVVSAAMLWSDRRRTIVAATAVLAVLWGGLVLTFSQSSFASLLVGLAVLAAIRWNPRRVAALSAIGLALATVFVLAFQSTLRIHLDSSTGLNKVTSGRSDLIRGGVRLFAERPLWGYGSGAFARTYRLKRESNQREAVSASHTLPVTVAAEQGLLGLAAYLLVLVAGFRVLLGRGSSAAAPRAPPPSKQRADGSAEAVPRGIYEAGRGALTAAFAALVAHTMMYAAFLEDPFTWVILAAGLAVVPLARRVPASGRVSRPAFWRSPATASSS
jgi:putative inorganic carbon (HCO3(-)) transporter